MHYVHLMQYACTAASRGSISRAPSARAQWPWGNGGRAAASRCASAIAVRSWHSGSTWHSVGNHCIPLCDTPIGVSQSEPGQQPLTSRYDQERAHDRSAQHVHVRRRHALPAKFGGCRKPSDSASQVAGAAGAPPGWGCYGPGTHMGSEAAVHNMK